MRIQYRLYFRNYLLNISITYIDSNHDTPFGCISVNLKRTINQTNRCDFTDRQLNIFGSTHKKSIQIQVFYLIIVQTKY